ncbi:thioredoxin family protein [Streptomyces globisporus]|uniref:thioredoxin family protein n=1 Tax=Streptomyces globisporus TaxID=1908 RepID=UPI0036FE4CB4
MSPEPLDVTDTTFAAQVLGIDGPVIVHFWAEWAGPCKMIKADFDALASTYAGRLTVARLNIDQNPETAPRHNVKGLPTLIVFKTGAEAARKVGPLSKGQLTEFVEANL